MTPFGIGTDILEIERIQEAVSKHGDHFIQRIFTSQEQNYCRQYRDPIPHFAALFSVKESIAKALGCGIGEKLGWQDIEIEHDTAGKPIVKFSTKIQQSFNHPQVIISISHCRAYVSTVALLAK